MLAPIITKDMKLFPSRPLPPKIKNVRSRAQSLDDLKNHCSLSRHSNVANGANRHRSSQSVGHLPTSTSSLASFRSSPKTSISMCKPTTLDAIMEGVEMNNSSHNNTTNHHHAQHHHHKYTSNHHAKNTANNSSSIATKKSSSSSIGCSIMPKRSVTKRSANGIADSNDNDDLDFDYMPSATCQSSLAVADQQNSSSLLSSSSSTPAADFGCDLNCNQVRSSPNLEGLFESDSLSSTTKTISAPSLDKSADNVTASRRKSSKKIVKWLTGALKSKSNSINKQQIVNTNRDNNSIGSSNSSKDSGNSANNSGKVRRVIASQYTT